jgi:transposase
MGKRKRRRFTPQQKAQAVEIVRTSGKSVTEVARDLDLTASALGAWVKQAEIDAGNGPAGALTTNEREELAELRRDKKRLEQENAFLKNRPGTGGRPLLEEKLVLV